ncbi:MAG: branched-chain amino acid ABC transporter permease, partial [Burkholderiaceae bacterium]|nr:branched-chain amino acid ABC transporter permease [Burkholderiaceae bacterium]
MRLEHATRVLPLGVGMGLLLEVGLLRYFQEKDPVLQLLVTFAAFVMFEDLQKLIWGTSPYSAGELVMRLGTIEVFNVTYTTYQVVVIPCIALISYVGLNFFLKQTSLGK